ncbi:DUF2158 domain-containing protein [Rhizobium sp. SG741]|uniref:YodC family protein n=1 Tax=Rhizobium sp. SG741 TaxID=2587114 RepID=UPI001446CA71|nr:DUF2158 domain-containing protein [Rhizobium sp. SG741]NKJ03464.1 uncharacterized protein YodC (DUF2158 family) [Rhizobium sp. SG741]
MEFEKGDVVQLKSGGPKMTISDIGKYNYADYDSANCDWFIADKSPWKKESAIFPLHSLKKAE